MPLEYSPKDAETAWPEGQYPATLTNVEDKTSSKGNPMQVWKFQVFDDQGQREQVITEYITKASLFKLRQLASALNCSADFKAGTFQADAYINANVMVSLVVEPATAEYDEKNRINHISARPPINRQQPPRQQQPARSSPAPQKVIAGAPADDEIPF